MTPTGSFMENVISSFQTGFRQLLMTFGFAVCRFQWKKKETNEEMVVRSHRKKHYILVYFFGWNTMYLLRNDK